MESHLFGYRTKLAVLSSKMYINVYTYTYMYIYVRTCISYTCIRTYMNVRVYIQCTSPRGLNTYV